MSERPGNLNALADISGVSVGHAFDAAARTGTTVLRFDKAMRCAVDMRGGGPATRETDAVAPSATLGIAHALILSGGSVFGLGAADKVAALLSAQGFGLRLKDGTPAVPIVPAACLYDLANGGEKTWGELPPYAGLAEQAFAQTAKNTAIGAIGAGFGAMAGTHRGGLGQASIMLDDSITVAAMIAVNAIGSPLMSDGRTFWAWPFERGAEFGGARPDPAMPAPETLPPDIKSTIRSGEATCIGAVAVSTAVDRASLHRIAIMAQDGLARAIRPSHAPFDGDTIFALCPDGESTAPPEQVMRLGAAAADCVARAVARGVWAAGKSACS